VSYDTSRFFCEYGGESSNFIKCVSGLTQELLCSEEELIITHYNSLETIIKETEQNQLTWYGHVQRMAEERLPKIALKWVPKQKRARGRPKKN
jgi:hypothetical protein